MEQIDTVTKNQVSPDAEFALCSQKFGPYFSVGLLIGLFHSRLQPSTQAHKFRHRISPLISGILDF
jgi:hypothetical protein